MQFLISPVAQITYLCVIIAAIILVILSAGYKLGQRKYKSSFKILNDTILSLEESLRIKNERIALLESPKFRLVLDASGFINRMSDIQKILDHLSSVNEIFNKHSEIREYHLENKGAKPIIEEANLKLKKLGYKLVDKPVTFFTDSF